MNILMYKAYHQLGYCKNTSIIHPTTHTMQMCCKRTLIPIRAWQRSLKLSFKTFLRSCQNPFPAMSIHCPGRSWSWTRKQSRWKQANLRVVKTSSQVHNTISPSWITIQGSWYNYPLSYWALGLFIVFNVFGICKYFEWNLRVVKTSLQVHNRISPLSWTTFDEQGWGYCYS